MNFREYKKYNELASFAPILDIEIIDRTGKVFELVARADTGSDVTTVPWKIIHQGQFATTADYLQVRDYRGKIRKTPTFEAWARLYSGEPGHRFRCIPTKSDIALIGLDLLAYYTVCFSGPLRGFVIMEENSKKGQ